MKVNFYNLDYIQLFTACGSILKTMKYRIHFWDQQTGLISARTEGINAPTTALFDLKFNSNDKFISISLITGSLSNKFGIISADLVSETDFLDHLLSVIPFIMNSRDEHEEQYESIQYAIGA